jgi:hypothetical protein
VVTSAFEATTAKLMFGYLKNAIYFLLIKKSFKAIRRTFLNFNGFADQSWQKLMSV